MKQDREQARIFEDANIISSYTSEQAIEDGILYDVTTLNPVWKRGIFNYVTTGLLRCGYIDNGTIKLPNLADLLNQSLRIVSAASKNFTEQDWFYSGEIELPSGEQQTIFIVQNETEKYTLMLPEEY